MTKNLAVETLGSKTGVLTQNDCACPKPGAVTLEAGLLKVRANQDCACPNPSAVVLETNKAIVADSDCACPQPASADSVVATLPKSEVVTANGKRQVVAECDCACPMPAESVANAIVAKQGQNGAEIRVSVVTPTL